MVAALLIADGDRLPVDTTVNMGSAAAASGVGMGVARSTRCWHRPTPRSCPRPSIARTVSVCDVGDPVCDYDPDTTEVSPAEIAIHTSYAPAASGSHAWTPKLYDIVMSADAPAGTTVALS